MNLNDLLTASYLCFGAVRLRQASVAVKFVTNTTKESKRNLLERLQRLNFDLQVKHPFHFRCGNVKDMNRIRGLVCLSVYYPKTNKCRHSRGRNQQLIKR